MESEGADLIDIGGESTRPRAIYKDAAPIGAEEELARVVPVLRALRGVVATPLSIDTYKAEVAEVALKEGATLINDVSFLADPDMLKVARESGAPLVITHNGRDEQRYDDGDVVMIIDELEEAVKGARQAGIKDDQIIVDPGIGFAKGMATNLAIIRQLRKFKSRLDYPLLAGYLQQGVYRSFDRFRPGRPPGGEHRRQHTGGGQRCRYRTRPQCGGLYEGVGGSRPDSTSGRWLIMTAGQAVEAYLAIGSNVGDRMVNFREAIARLRRSCELLECSPIYETEPWEMPAGTDKFLNGALHIRTELAPSELLRTLKAIEHGMGRPDNSSDKPRVIDIDILLYGDLVKHDPNLNLDIPHLEMSTRAFVLRPLNDIAAQVVHPERKLTVSQLLDSLDQDDLVGVELFHKPLV